MRRAQRSPDGSLVIISGLRKPEQSNHRPVCDDIVFRLLSRRRRDLWAGPCARRLLSEELMIRAFYAFSLCVALLLGCVTGGGQTQTPGPDQWVDYALGDYDITPNITYAVANNTELKLDLYLPRNRNTPNPTLMLFHGGGWVDGQKERNVFQLLPYLSMGWTVLNVEYRLARNSPAPAAVEDCRCALRWVAYHAKEYSLDTSRIVLTGGSAGGHLSLI